MRSKLNRRTFLRSSGIALGLPILQSMAPRSAQAANSSGEARRMLAMCAPLGIHTPNLFPTTAGKAYEVTPYLEPLQPVRNKFSVISGLMHPMVDGGHAAEKSYLTGAAHPGQPSFRNSISVDQYAAERIGHLTRFPFLSLTGSNTGMSYTRSGVLIPAESKPSRVFQQLFLEGSASEKQAQIRRIQDGQSILDLVGSQTRKIQRATGREDQQTLDQYLTSVRELEQRLVQQEAWAKLPKPIVDAKPPTDIEDRANFSGQMKLLFDLIALALQTDSTRLITLKGPGGNEVVSLNGVDDGWHNLSHHGRSPEKIDQLSIIEKEEMRLFSEFLQKLNSIQEGEKTLLDQTAILMGSSLGNASSHNNSNLPIVVAGGNFQHGQHLAFNEDKAPPMANILVSFLQHLELEIDEFSTGTGTLKGLSL
ncbi:DUF1552 domain-containing protein [Rubinisphaera sp.]|uniref:DUF1552 domain-containing protein n=1 Tax=Rubinisphaera sp. TaxID=2024857 RepID=UPI000C0E3572|nr:DUF1552 domain-containing protein [Rubinisphaera sp.]MBV12277.1 hypothetical protein [Rubinisphaera sp.]HCS55290.1 hypothetical protein [Planctomycetaceae bacterium]|tara:strand:- start:4066 stop:5331 length:1266 start_codon:yes stop_codon:yes gene_type:complete